MSYLLLGSDCRPTPDLCLLEWIDGEPAMRFFPEEIARPVADVDYERLMLAPGDGRITRRSLLGHDVRQRGALLPAFPIDAVTFACEDHARLPGHVVVRHNLLEFLLVLPGRPTPSPARRGAEPPRPSRHPEKPPADPAPDVPGGESAV